MVKINGNEMYIEGRRPWADAPSEPIPGQRIRRNMLYPGLNWDSPEKIQQCLNCTNPECNERCPGKRPKRYHTPMPEDFPEKKRLLRCTDLAEHYGVSDWIIWRWRKELRKKGEK